MVQSRLRQSHCGKDVSISDACSFSMGRSMATCVMWVVIGRDVRCIRACEFVMRIRITITCHVNALQLLNSNRIEILCLRPIFCSHPPAPACQANISTAMDVEAGCTSQPVQNPAGPVPSSQLQGRDRAALGSVECIAMHGPPCTCDSYATHRGHRSATESAVQDTPTRSVIQSDLDGGTAP